MRHASTQPDGTDQDERGVADRPRRLRQGLRLGQATLSTKHALALTNRGGATTSELLALAARSATACAAYGITLVNEPVLVGCEL